MQDALGVARSIPIALRGELYKIRCNVKYPQASRLTAARHPWIEVRDVYQVFEG